MATNVKQAGNGANITVTYKTQTGNRAKDAGTWKFSTKKNNVQVITTKVKLKRKSKRSSKGVMYTVFWKLSTQSTPNVTLAAVQNWSPVVPSLPQGTTTKVPPSGVLRKGVVQNNLGGPTGSHTASLGYVIRVSWTPPGKNQQAVTFTSSDPELVLPPPN